MAARRQARSLVPNIIPLAGVALLIVLMLMMTSTHLLTHERVKIQVPMAKTMQRRTEENLTIALAIDSMGQKRTYLNDSLMALSTIERVVANRLSEEPYYLLVIRADRRIPFQSVMEVLSMVRQYGAQRIAISTKSPRKKAAEGT